MLVNRCSSPVDVGAVVCDSRVGGVASQALESRPNGGLSGVAGVSSSGGVGVTVRGVRETGSLGGCFFGCMLKVKGVAGFGAASEVAWRLSTNLVGDTILIVGVLPLWNELLRGFSVLLSNRGLWPPSSWCLSRMCLLTESFLKDT